MTTLEQAQKDGVVLGLGDATGEVRQRLDIDDLLVKYPKTFNLFLLALRELQDEKFTNDKMGWFQIAGIHGLPLKDWDGVSGILRDGNRGSYCPHGTILFPTWHRPYLAMLEQTIYYRMSVIAKRFKEPGEHVEAVKDFRLPFWDYFRPRGGNTRFPGVRDGSSGTTGYGFDFSLPYILEVDKVMVLKPNENPSDDPSEEKKLKEIDNPLASFKFPTNHGLRPEEWGDYIKQRPMVRTLRYPDPNSGKSDHRLLNTALLKNRESNIEKMLNLFDKLKYKDYVAFAFKAYVKDPGTGKLTKDVDPAFSSIESLHDSYHGLLGGGGHLSSVPIAAFDPAFWIHHCNVDRIVALWQGINPDSWFPNTPLPVSPYQRDNTAPETQNDNLLPFRCPQSRNAKGFWSSVNARNAKDLGYTFAELEKVSESKTSSQDLLVLLKQKYAWSSQSYNGRAMNPTVPDEMKPQDDKVAASQTFKYTSMTLQERLSRDIQPISTQRASNQILAPQPVFHSLMAAPKLQELQTTVNMAPLGVLPAEQISVAVKEASLQDQNLTEGKPNETDKDLLAHKSKQTGILRQWYVDVRVQKTAFNGAFNIYYFAGDFPENPAIWDAAPTLAGLSYVFTAPLEACDNCGIQARQGLRFTDTTPITPILHDFVTNRTLTSLDPEHVVPFLRTNLHWRAIGAFDTQTTPSADVAGLEVSVSCDVSYLYPNDPQPVFIATQTYPEVTAGRDGGLIIQG